MNSPLVSVLMPCYNVENYIEESMHSILKQTYTNIEIIAIDDCSSDKTGEILSQLATTDSRIKVIKNPENLKLIRTLNKGIELCSGEYIARMDSDDIALPERIEKEVLFLEQNRDHGIVSCQFKAFRSESPNKHYLHHNPLHDDELRAYMLFKSGICHPAAMIRKQVFTELNLSFGLEYLHVEDYALWSQAIYKTKIANLPEALLLYRVHQNQVSSKNEYLQIENKKKVFAIHCQHLGLPQDDEYLDVYASVAESVPSIASLSYIDKCESFMLSLIKLNEEKNFCNGRYLEQMLSIHWLRLCANSRLGISVISKLKRSRLYIPSNYNSRDMLILYTKCLFKLKYKESFIYKIVFR